MKKPNILFIMCDQMRFDAIGAHGNSIIKTPNMDRLAKMGVDCINAYTPNPICVPARASLTTGMYSHKCIGRKDNDGSIKEGCTTLGAELKDRGYDTYAIGKLHYLPYMPPKEGRTLHGLQNVELYESGRISKIYDPKCEQEGVEDYYDYLKEVGWSGYTRAHGLGNNDVYGAPSAIPEEHYVDGWVANRAIHYMDKHLEEKDSPFFMWASFPKPHSAYDPPRPYDMLYDPREMPEPVGDIKDIESRGLDYCLQERYKFMWDKLSPESVKQIRAYYYGLITYQDKQIGKMIDYLEEKDLLEDTIIVYTTDHGDMLGDYGLFFKRLMYNPSVKIPLIISYPKVFDGDVKHDRLVGLQDLLPTLCSLVGEPLYKEVDGLDVVNQLNGAEDTRNYFVSQCNGSDDNAPERQMYMVTDGVYKLIYTVYGGVYELYNMKNDPYEKHNLINDEDQSERITELKDYLYKWCINNEDSEMLHESGKLLKVNKKLLPKVKHINDFGRRFY